MNEKKLKPWQEDNDELDDSTITAAKVNQITREGESYVPQNEAEKLLKDEIMDAMAEGAIIDVPANGDDD